MVNNLRIIGVVGLGRMGFPLCERLHDFGYNVVGYDRDESPRYRFRTEGMTDVDSLENLCNSLFTKKVIILLVPAGDAVDEAIAGLSPFLNEADVLLDFGNSNYLDSRRRAERLSTSKIDYIDVGMSGGISGARNGACLTIGGPSEVVTKLNYLFSDIAAPGGYTHVGPSGWGHLVKTIHNGIEYGFLQAIGEGLHVIEEVANKECVSIDMEKLCNVWNNGSIIASRLMADAAEAVRLLAEHPEIDGKVGGGETGKWAQEIAEKFGVPVPSLDAALAYRKRSLKAPDFTGRVIAAIRNLFGGHKFV